VATGVNRIPLFKNWTRRETSGEPVTTQYKEDRAKAIASALVTHDRWKNHGHAISREVLWESIKLKIEHPEQELERAIMRLWALFCWMFDKTPILKAIISQNYRYIRQLTRVE